MLICKMKNIHKLSIYFVNFFSHFAIFGTSEQIKNVAQSLKLCEALLAEIKN